MPRKLQTVRSCTKCGSTANEFSKCSKVSDGLSSWCKLCHSEHNRKKYASNPDFRKQQLATSAGWAKRNPDRVVAKTLKWQRNNPDKCERVRSRRHLTNRRPAWAVPFFIQEAYALARLRTKTTGFMWVVDHIIPLKGKLVSGLHVETNLRVIPASQNSSKSNHFSL